MSELSADTIPTQALICFIDFWGIPADIDRITCVCIDAFGANHPFFRHLPHFYVS